MATSTAAPARRSPARRAAILAFAWEIFLEKGYGGASMSDITERVGGSKATLYSHFRSKQELFLAVVHQKGEELYAAVSYPPKQTGNLAEDLTDFGCRLLDIVLSEKYVAYFRLVVAEAARFPMISATEYEARRDAMLAPLGGRILHEMKAGRLRLADHLEAAEIFWNLCIATVQRRALIEAMRVLTIQEIQYVAARATSILLAAYSVTDKAAE
jgi:AcrR family transcriptional regulator